MAFSKFVVFGLDGCIPGVIDEYLAKGELPNFARLKENGCKGINLPFTSAVTPGNWAAIASGSHPGTNGISDFSVHIPGESFEIAHKAFDKQMCKAELLWDALSRQGAKVATMNYPCGVQVTSENHTAIGDEGFPVENSLTYMLSPARLLASVPPKSIDAREWIKEYENVDMNKNAKWEDVPADCQVLSEWAFSAKATNADCAGAYDKYIAIFRQGDVCKAVVAPRRSFKDADCIMDVKTWSPWQEGSFSLHGETVMASWRYRLMHADENGEMQLYISVIYPQTHFTQPLSVGETLYKELGQYGDILNISKVCAGWLDPEGLMDEFRLQGIWQAKAAVKLTKEMGYTGVFSKWHAFDKFYHFLFDKIDPMAVCYEPERAEYFEGIHRSILKIADEMVGIILDGMDEETTLVVISDHGLMPSRKLAWVNNFLARNGYIKTKINDKGEEVIDYPSTKAIMRPYVMMWINLKGRDPEGCVEPEEYDSLCREIINKLRDWRDEETGEYVLEEAFQTKDGAFYGLWGERDGDIRIHTRPGYTLYRSTEVTPDRCLTSRADGFYRGDHGSCRPTTHFGRGSECAMFFICGNKIRKNHELSRPIQPCDVVPTLCHIIGAEPTRQCEGAVLYECLER